MTKRETSDSSDELRLVPLDDSFQNPSVPAFGDDSLDGSSHHVGIFEWNKDGQAGDVAGESVPGELTEPQAEVEQQSGDDLREISGAKEAPQLSDEEIIRRRQWRRLMLEAVPSWLVSLLVHTILIVVLATITLDPVSTVLSVLDASSSAQESDGIEEFSIEVPVEQPAESLSEAAMVAPASLPQSLELPALPDPASALTGSELPAMDMESLIDSVLPRNLLDANTASQLSSMLTSRSAAAKSEMLEKYGGSAESEKSVALALKWLAAHQLTRGPMIGAWNFNHGLAGRSPSSGYGEFTEAVNGATAMALLPFLGAGQTHVEGQYKETVKAGLAALITNMKLTNQPGLPYGSWHERQGNMYSHGLAAITICEAYAMTRDPDLMQPAQLALNYLIYAQDPVGGGWRYAPKQAGDTSVVGWCLMALKSGKMGNLTVPPAVFYGANQFLDMVSTDQGAYYGYDKPSATKRRGTTAVGLLCRMYLGWPKDHPALYEGVQYLAQQGPRLDDLYYSYYATQVMRHYGGEPWRVWNEKMRSDLVQSQVKEGQDAGSWEPRGGHSREGGRLYQTSLATMILEVYYRHLPLYSEQSLGEDEFEI